MSTVLQKLNFWVTLSLGFPLKHATGVLRSGLETQVQGPNGFLFWDQAPTDSGKSLYNQENKNKEFFVKYTCENVFAQYFHRTSSVATFNKLVGGMDWWPVTSRSTFPSTTDTLAHLTF